MRFYYQLKDNFCYIFKTKKKTKMKKKIYCSSILTLISIGSVYVCVFIIVTKKYTKELSISINFLI